MHENRFHGQIDRLRSPERLAWLEVDRVTDLSLQNRNFENVLDVGTGSGIFAEAFDRAGLNVEGLDANPEMLAAARMLLPNIHFEEGIAESLPYPDKSFDMVFMGLLFHEADDRAKSLHEAARCARQRVAILEWPYESQPIGPGLDERITEAQLNTMAEKTDLRILQTVHLQALVLYIFEPTLN